MTANSRPFNGSWSSNHSSQSVDFSHRFISLFLRSRWDSGFGKNLDTMKDNLETIVRYRTRQLCQTPTTPSSPSKVVNPHSYLNRLVLSLPFFLTITCTHVSESNFLSHSIKRTHGSQIEFLTVTPFSLSRKRSRSSFPFSSLAPSPSPSVSLPPAPPLSHSLSFSPSHLSHIMAHDKTLVCPFCQEFTAFHHAPLA
jgi:hypothetical protein